MQGADSRKVLTYFDACNTGDIRELMATLDTNIVHYFLPPVHRAIHV